MIDDVLKNALEERRAQQLYRTRKIVESAQGVEVIVDGKKYLNFCSNDYLGLANHPSIVEAFKKTADEFGVGSGASHLVCGHSSIHHELEENLAEFTGRERALLFSAGYMANLGVITALLDKGDFIFEDKLNHASLIDAGLLSGARFQRFLHNDIDNLRSRLERVAGSEPIPRPEKIARSEQIKGGRKLICVDGVFSMDGDIAPLAELAQLARQHDAWLMVDDAHGFGVLGKNGAGCAEHFNLDQNQLPILMGTLGKACGGFGAFIAGSEALIETLIQFARPYIYTTALPPAVAAAALRSLKIIRDESWRREHLQKLIARFRNGARQLDLPLMNSASAIQPLLVSKSVESVDDAARALAFSEKLAAQGFWIGAIRPPTVPAGTARLRITLSAAHSETQIDRLLDALKQVTSEV